MGEHATENGLSLRNAQQGDAEAACALVRRSILELCKLDHANDPLTLEGWLCNKTPQNMEVWITTPGTTCFLAQIDEALAGVGVVTDYGEVLLAYVAPEFRFRGVTKSLLERMESHAHAQHADLFSDDQSALVKEWPKA